MIRNDRRAQKRPAPAALTPSRSSIAPMRKPLSRKNRSIPNQIVVERS